MSKYLDIGLISHIVIAIAIWLCVTLLCIYWLPSLVGIAGSFIALYSREHSQEERKKADKLGINHKDLWKYPKDFAYCLWPGSWSKHNMLGFIIPMLVVVCIAILREFI